VEFVLFLLVGAVVVAVGIGAAVLSQRRMQQMEHTYQQLCLDHGLAPTDRPLGLSDAWLAQFGLLPKGDRNCSAVWGVEGPGSITVDGQPLDVDCAAFEWWWEDRQTSRDANGHTRTTWVRKSVMACVVRLPAPYLMPRISVEPSGFFARLGLGGRGFEVESEEFNRRYDVRVERPDVAIRLFSADFQLRMLETFTGATFELAGDLAVVGFPTPGSSSWSFGSGGGPTRGGAGGLAGMLGMGGGDRIRADVRIVEALPGVRHRGLAMLHAMPDSWWRAVAGGPA
jgi:hypothetical protein